MNTKVEPVLTEEQTNQSEDFSTLPKDTTIEKFLELVKKQTDLNSQILTALKSKDIPKEDRMQMVNMLTDGAQKNSFFMKIIKDKEKSINLEINDSIPSKESQNIKDKFNNFKNMIISFKANIDPTITFRNPLRPDWYEVGYKVGAVISTASNKTQSTHKTLVSFFKQTAENIGVAVKEIKNKKNLLQSQFYLIGERRNVKQLEKKFAKVFDVLGLEPKEMLHSSELKQNISEEELLKKISNKLNKEFSIVKDPSDNKFSFTILEGLTPELKMNMLKDLVWPKLTNALKECMSVNVELQESKNDNKYLQMVLDFSKENNFNPDLVIHSLRHNQELLSGYPKVQKLINNKDNIIQNADKYGKFLLNNFVYLESLIKVSNDMTNIIKSLNIPTESKDSFLKDMNNLVIFSQNDKPVTYEQLKANIVSITPEEKNYNPQLKKDVI